MNRRLVTSILVLTGLLVFADNSQACLYLPIAILEPQCCDGCHHFCEVGVESYYEGCNSYDPDIGGSIIRYEWDWNNDGIYDEDTGSYCVAYHTYTRPGTHTIRLKVTDIDNQVGTDTYTINVLAGPDSDGDKLPDNWEQYYWSSYEYDGTGDYDRDGYNNLSEYLHDSDPTDDGITPSSNVTIHVPADAASIQGAIYASIDGDTIEVSEGTYHENINFNGRQITLSSTDPLNWAVVAATIIDGGGSSTVKFDSGETSSSVLSGFTITGGDAQFGGGIYCWETSPTITNCVITGNNATENGGGMYSAYYSYPVISNCIFSGNTAVDNGGGMSIEEMSDATITNCLFHGNSAGSRGGGIVTVNSCNPVITNCTFSGNDGAINGGGFASDLGGHASITNCIFWDNSSGGSYDEIFNGFQCNTTVTYSCVQGGWIGGNNIDTDPLYIDAGNPAGPDGVPGTSDDGLCVIFNSGCIDGGTVPAGGLPSTDIEGDTRTRDGDGDGTITVDMGAYEANKIWFVKWCAGGSANGSDWDNAFTELSTALSHPQVIDGDEIWVAGGEYKPDTAGLSDTREATFALVEGVSVYGGFEGTMANPFTRNFSLYETTLSGDLDDDDVGNLYDPSRAENSYNVVRCLTNRIVLDGFTITGGNANEFTSPNYNGGGMSFRFGLAGLESTISNCIFTDNYATNNGGGISLRSKNSVTVTNCTFEENRAQWGGGAMVVGRDNATVKDCYFMNNEADYGGAVSDATPNLKLINCVFSGNAAVAGGTYVQGGAVHGYSTALADCTLANNRADEGGGIYSEGSVVVTNCILWNNSRAGEINDELGQIEGNATVTHSCVQDTDPDDETIYPGTGNIDDDPRFVDLGGWKWQLMDGTPLAIGDPVDITDDQIMIYDFSDNHSDFERGSGQGGGHNPEYDGTGIVFVKSQLEDGSDNFDIDGYPQFVGSSGSSTTTNERKFESWFNTDDFLRWGGPNISKEVPSWKCIDAVQGIFRFNYDETELYEFFPIDDCDSTPPDAECYGKQGYDHNYDFTFQYRNQCTYIPGQSLRFRASDDLFVFINGKLVINRGGYWLDEDRTDETDTLSNSVLELVNGDAKVYDYYLYPVNPPATTIELGLNEGDTFDFDVFYANRDRTNSVLMMEAPQEMQLVFAPGDYHLQSDSPCINSGDNAAVPDGIETDVEGLPRFAGGVVDRGAYEDLGGNALPTVDAGDYPPVVLPRNALYLDDASVTDDGLPIPPGDVTTLWECTDCPFVLDCTTDVTFDDDSKVNTVVRGLTSVGDYTFRLTADDDSGPVSNEVIVTVYPQPWVDAGYRQIITAPDDITQPTTPLEGEIKGDVTGLIVATKWTVFSQPMGGSVTFSDTVDSYSRILKPNVQFAAGVESPPYYWLKLTGYSDPEMTDEVDSDTVDIKVKFPVGSGIGNEAPEITMPAPQTIILPLNSGSLDARVTDDGKPYGRLTRTWSVVVYPPGASAGDVTFLPSNSVEDPKVVFPDNVTGDYILQLEVDDEGGSPAPVSGMVTITVARDNEPPTVDAGYYTVPAPTTEGDTVQANLNNTTVEDDGELNPLTYEWKVLRGPDGATVTFDPPLAGSPPDPTRSGAENPTVTLTKVGEYILRLEAFDGQHTKGDNAVVHVGEPVGGYSLTVFAGLRKELTQPASIDLDDASVTVVGDTGPVPVTKWSSVDGPGLVEFGDDSMVNTWVRFERPGIYILELEAADGLVTKTDQVIVDALPGTRLGGGEDHTIIILQDGTVVGCGLNDYGQLGNDNSINQMIPVPVLRGEQELHPSYLAQIQTVEAGWLHSLALDMDRNVWAYGSNVRGQLGTGAKPTTKKETPMHVRGGDMGATATIYLSEGLFEDQFDYDDIDAVSVVDSDTVILSSRYDNTILGDSVNNWTNGVEFDKGDLVKYFISEDRAEMFFTGDERFLDIGENIDAVYYISEDEIILSTVYEARLGNNNLTFQPGDLVKYNLQTYYAELFFNGWNLFGATADIDAIHVISDNEIILSTAGDAVLAGLDFTDSDLVKVAKDAGDDFITGPVTATLYFDGAMFDDEADIDATSILINGHPILSTYDSDKTLIWLTFTGGDLVEYVAGATYLENIVAIGAGRSGEHSLAVDADGFLWAWGVNDYGQLGIGNFDSLDNRRLPKQVLAGEQGPGFLENALAVSGGSYHSMVLEKLTTDPMKQGRVYTFGAGDDKCLGNGSTSDSDVPVIVQAGEQKDVITDSLDNIVAVSAGLRHCMALEKIEYDPDPSKNLPGRVYTWGSNNYLGNGQPSSTRPIIVHAGGQDPAYPHDPEHPLKNIIAISAGAHHSMALDGDGHVWTWGSSNSGQLGNGKWTYSDRPVKVIAPDEDGDDSPDDLNENDDLEDDFLGDDYYGEQAKIIDISAGYDHCLALDMLGNVWSWGLGSWGRLGIGSTSNKNVPQRVHFGRVFNNTRQTWHPTIQEALAEALSGDEIIVYPGRYTGNFTLDKNVTLRSIEPSNWNIVASTVIDGYGQPAAINFADSDTSQLSGFTITLGYDGITCQSNSQPTIKNNWIMKNRHHGIWCSSTASCTIRNNFICDNASTGTGDGIRLESATDVSITGNTISNNWRGIYRYQGTDPEIRHSIIWNNGSTAPDDDLSGIFDDVAYCYVGGGQYPGPGNIDSDVYTDPMFVDATNGDYHIELTSPCKDAGFNDTTTAAGTKTTIVVTDGTLYTAGDVIEIGNDGVPRIIVSPPSGGTITFTPSLGLDSVVGMTVINWFGVDDFTDITTADGTDEEFVVGNAWLYQDNDTIKIGSDTVYRIVTDIDSSSNTVTFAPAYVSPAYVANDTTIRKWSLWGEADIDADPRKMGAVMDMGADELPLLDVDAGADKNITLLEVPLGLNDATVVDPDGDNDPDPATWVYEWRVLSAPQGSSVSFTPPLSESETDKSAALDPGVDFDTQGTYVLRLVVFSQGEICGGDTVVITASAGAEAGGDQLKILPEHTADLSGDAPGAARTEWFYLGSADGVVFGNPDSLDTLVTLPEEITGTYVLWLVAYDDDDWVVAYDSVIVRVSAAEIVVEAGDLKEVDMPVSGPAVVDLDDAWIDFDETAIDPGSVTEQWSCDGPVVFTYLSELEYWQAEFTQPGDYELSLTAKIDGVPVETDTVWVYVNFADGDPHVEAGSPKWCRLSGVPLECVVPLDDAWIWDDGVLNPEELTPHWTGPASVSFGGAEYTPDPTATFTESGVFTLTLWAEDGGSPVGSDTVDVTVYDEAQALMVDMGGPPPPTQMPGQLEPPNGDPAEVWLHDVKIIVQSTGLVTIDWTVVQGDQADVIIIDDEREGTLVKPIVQFNSPGTYRLKLTATQNVSSDSGEITVIVFPYDQREPDDTPPTIDPDPFSVTIGGVPINPSSVCGQVDITVMASDVGWGISELVLALDPGSCDSPTGILKTVSGSPGYPKQLQLDYVVNTHYLTNDDHTLCARVEDRNGNFATSTVEFTSSGPSSTAPPVAKITNTDFYVDDRCLELKVDPLPILQEGLFELTGAAYHPDFPGEEITYSVDLFKPQIVGLGALSEWNNDARVLHNECRISKNPLIYAENVAGVVDGVLGVLDFTGLENGAYQMLLTVTAGTSKYVNVGFVLDSQLKVGNVRFSQEDLVIPAGRMPLRVIRTYDSLNRDRDSEFGYGWDYSIATMDIELDEDRMENVELQDSTGDWVDRSVRTGSNYDRDVTLTLPDGRRATFRFRLDGSLKAKYDSPDGVSAKLQTWDPVAGQANSEQMVSTFLGTYWKKQGQSSMGEGERYPENYDFPGFVLTTEDGMKYYFDRKNYGTGDFGPEGSLYYLDYCPFYAVIYGEPYLSEIVSPSGEEIRFNVDEESLEISDIQSWAKGASNPSSTVEVEYDIYGHITGIWAPSEQLDEFTGSEDLATIEYVYDPASHEDLIAVRKLVNKYAEEGKKYEATTYVYDTEHYISDIQDDRGLVPIRYVYDPADDDRLTGIYDAKNNYINIDHEDTDYPDDNVEVVVDRLGNETIYFYNERGNVVTIQNDLGEQTTYTYGTGVNLDRPTSVTTPIATTTYAYSNYPDGAIETEIITDPVYNVTANVYDSLANIVETSQWRLTATTPSTFPLDYRTNPPSDYAEVSSTRSAYNLDNLLIFTGTTTGQLDDPDWQWHNITVNYYDLQNHLIHTVKLDMNPTVLQPDDFVRFNDLVDDTVADDEALTYFSNIMQLNNDAEYDLDYHIVTTYEYSYANSGSYDQPWRISDPYYGADVADVTDPFTANEVFTRYSQYDENGRQTLSWYEWEDPSDGDTTLDHTVYTHTIYDDDGRVIQTSRQIDSDPAIILSETGYNSIGKTATTEGEHLPDDGDGLPDDGEAGILTEYDYDELGSLVETRTYEPVIVDPGGGNDPYWEFQQLTTTRTLYDAEGRVLVTVGPYATGDQPVGTETVYDELGRVIETRRWADVVIDLVDFWVDKDGEHGTPGQIYEGADIPYGEVPIGIKVPAGTVVANAWDDDSSNPTAAPGWTSNGDIPVVDTHIYNSDNHELPLSYTRTVYDVAGRVKHSLTLDENGDEQPTTYYYDDAGKQTRIVDPNGHRSLTYVARGETGFREIQQIANGTFDDTEGSGNLTGTSKTVTQYIGMRRWKVTDAREFEAGAGAGAYTTEFHYDDLGRLEMTTHPSVDYVDHSDNPQTGPLYTHVGYDGLGRKEWQSNATYRSTGLTSEDGLKSLDYDASGRLTKVTLPEPQSGAGSPIYKYFYDDYGNQVAILDPEMRLTVFKYDEQARQTTTYMPFVPTNPLPGAITNAAHVYDALNNASPEPSSEARRYDSLGRLEKLTDFKGQVTLYEYFDAGCGCGGQVGQLKAKNYYLTDPGSTPPPADSEITYTYDNLGRKLTATIVDTTGTPTYQRCYAYLYDSEGRIETTKIYPTYQDYLDETNLIDSIGYGYDAVTERRDLVLTPDDGTDVDSQVGYTYDQLGRLEKVIVDERNDYVPGGSNPDEISTYTYNPVGSRASLTYANGNYTEYDYDPMNRLTSLVNYTDATPGTTLSSFSYKHYADGMRRQLTENFTENRTVVYGYDNLNRLTGEDAEETDSVNSYGYEATYTYDLAGNRTSRTIKVCYEDTGSPAAQTITTTYDYYNDDCTPAVETDRLYTETHAISGAVCLLPGTRYYACAAKGQVTHYRAIGSSEDIGQFKAFFLGLPSVWSQYAFITVMALLAVAFLAPVPPHLLRRKDEAAGKRRVIHLSLCRRCLCVLIAYVMLVTPLGFQQLAQADVFYQNLRASDWGVDGETITYTYDANGSVETKVVNIGGTETTFTYIYNLQNRLARVEKVVTGSTTVEITEYKYNPQGIRVEKHTWTKVGGTPQGDDVYTGYLIDAYNHTGYSQVFRETTGANVTTYIIGDDLLAQATGNAQNAPKYLLYDGHGSTRQLSDSTGSLITNESYSYDAYGVLLGGPRTTQTDLLYAGEMYDSVTDAYYLRARYYSASTGLFNRTDPFAGNNLDPQSLHKYLYAHGNPVNKTDPSGFGIGVVIAMVLVYAILWGVHLWDYHNPKENRIRNKFDRWYNLEIDGWWINVLPKCPCKIDTSGAKPVYCGADEDEWDKPEEPSEPEERLHPGIEFSMRSKVKQGHTNQCTYNINGKLITDYPMAGTVDWRPPFPSYLGIPHLEADVYPLHWAVYLDHKVTMHVFGGPKTPKDIGKYMKKYYSVRPLYDNYCR